MRLKLAECGGPAFPCDVTIESGELCGASTGPHTGIAPGMSLRDYFAAAALQGMAACQDFVNETVIKERCQSREETCAALARWAYKHADAMLAARCK